MSQSKVMEEVLEESNTNNSNDGRIQTRRSSRSTRSASPVMSASAPTPVPAAIATVKQEEEATISSPVSSEDEGEEEDQGASTAAAAATAATTATTLVNGKGRVTRSQSVESSGYETADSRKRKRKTNNTSSASPSASNNNKKRADSYQPSSHTMKTVAANAALGASSTPVSISTPNFQPIKAGGNTNNEDSERETRTASQRISKDAREAKKAQRDILIKERLDELDKLEKAVKDGSHSEYHRLLSDIEQKRTKMLYVAEMRKSLAVGNVYNFFNSQKNAAYSQYYWDKLALRRSMIQQVQHKINILGQEYYSNHVQSSLDDEHLSEWVPPDRPSMISSLTLGLSEEDAENDVEWARQDPREEESSSSKSYHAATYPPLHNNVSTPPQPYYQQKRESSPPLDTLASLADRQYQKDFKQESTEKSFTLPPLNPWRYDQQQQTVTK